MNEIAISQNSPPTRRTTAGQRHISKRLRHAVELLITGEAQTQKDAAEKAGLTRERLCRALKEDHVRAFQVQRCAEMFAGLLPKAIRTFDLTMDGGNAQAALNAALVVARQMGIVSPDGPSVAVTVNQPGYVIDLSGGTLSEPYRTIDANPLSDQQNVPAHGMGTPIIGPPDGADNGGDDA